MMKVEWLHHTGFNVSNMDQSLEFYRDWLGLEVTRDFVFEGEMLDKLGGIPGSKAHLVFLENGDGRHFLELVEWLSPAGTPPDSTPINDVGVSHLGLRIDNADRFYEELSSKGIRFTSPPVVRENATYPDVQKICFLQDPDGNRLELLELAPGP
jgi:catechol 2,3-dioxygenase-like lactoylglutathione lyase family enzyme